MFENIKNGILLNDFGFLSLDSKLRIFMIKKDDPELYQDNIIGVWVVSSFPSKRTRK